MKELRHTNWEAIEAFYKASEREAEYMSQHPLSHSEAVAQTQALHEMAERSAMRVEEESQQEETTQMGEKSQKHPDALKSQDLVDFTKSIWTPERLAKVKEVAEGIERSQQHPLSREQMIAQAQRLKTIKRK